MQRGYTSLLASKAQRWDAALKALQDAISTLAHFHAALASMPGAGPQQRTRAWFDNLLSQARAAAGQGLLLICTPQQSALHCNPEDRSSKPCSYAAMLAAWKKVGHVIKISSMQHDSGGCSSPASGPLRKILGLIT